MVNCESELVLEQIGINDYKTDWIDLFEYGSKIPKKGEGPKFDEVCKHYELVHNVTKEKLPVFNDEKLNDKSPTGFKLGRLETIEHTIMHAIRHEGCHSGHLGWLMKLYKNA